MTKHIPLAIALAVLAGGAVAGETADPQALSPAFGVVDGDQDGLISREEASRVPGLAESFDAIDADGDGRLSQQEYSAAMHGGRQS
ncbi:MAG: calcium-binding protein [Chromatiales bacterium]|jgi:Ca2+-binding EF-hand superfamily protein